MAVAKCMPTCDALVSHSVTALSCTTCSPCFDVHTRDSQEDGVIKSYKNQGDKAVEAMMYGVALMDRSHWGRLRVGGPGARRFLHAQTTADFDRLAPGQGTDTVFVTAQGRMVDLATAYMMGEQAALLVVSPGAGQSLLQRMDKHAFPADQVMHALS